MFKILVVEDNKILNYNFNEIVDWSSMDMGIVGNAFNGEQGLRMAVELKPDLIIADVDMPKLDGLEMCKRIKSALPSARFIFVSAFDSFKYVQEALELGAYKYILKPVMPDKLSAAALELYDIKKQDELNRETIKNLRDRLHNSDPLYSNGQNSENESNSENSPGSKERITAEIKRRIEENFILYNNLNDVVNGLDISAGYANTIFKAQTGMTIFDYLVRKKMTEAKRMLKDPFTRVYEVANNVGYANTSYFISVFKSYTGMTPKQYADRA